jgi:hypothetical protein
VIPDDWPTPSNVVGVAANVTQTSQNGGLRYAFFAALACHFKTCGITWKRVTRSTSSGSSSLPLPGRWPSRRLRRQRTHS